jgi:hypothetical protein
MKRYLDRESEISFYHVIIKVPDNTHGNHVFAFNRTHKQRLKEMFFWLEGIYELKCLCYTIMSTHAHFIICHEKGALTKVSLREAAKREQDYRGRKYALDARSCEVREFRSRLNDLSVFMCNLQKRFTRWYNRQGEKNRRGQLFNHNFKSFLLKDTKALIQCMQYVEMNPVRAQIVKVPDQYEFTSWADITQHKKLGNRLKNNIIYCLRIFNNDLNKLSNKQVFAMYADRLKLVCMALCELGGFKKLDRTILDELCQKQIKWSSAKIISSA